MEREELASLLNSRVRAGKITPADARAIMQRFAIGEIANVDLPLPLSAIPGKLTAAEFQDAIRKVAAYITPAQGRQRFLDTAKKPVTKQTPPEVKKFLRERLRNRLRGDYENGVRKATKAMAQGGDIAGWQKSFAREQRAYIARQYTAGVGRALTVAEMDDVNRLSANQQKYLTRFTTEIAARRALGRPFSVAYLLNRALQYQGVGWAAWFRGNNVYEARGDGKLIEYHAVDDGRTCGPCRDAEINGPYLPDDPNLPYPGEICRGHGLCRCRHEIIYDMERWREIKGEPAPPAPKPAPKPKKVAPKPRTKAPIPGTPIAPAQPRQAPIFSTLEEATRYAREQLNVTTNFAGGNVEQAQAVIQGIINVRARYAGPAAQQMRYVTFDEGMDSVGRWGERNGMYFNPRLFTQDTLEQLHGGADLEPAAIQKRLDRIQRKIDTAAETEGLYTEDQVTFFRQQVTDYQAQIDRGGATPGAYARTLIDVVHHEIGHGIHIDMQLGKVEGVTDFLTPSDARARGIDPSGSLASRLDSISRREWQTISEYAGKNDLEYMAETFAAYMNGEYDKINGEVLAIYRRIAP